jgi:hypothetical protein
MSAGPGNGNCGRTGRRPAGKACVGCHCMRIF